MTENNEQDRSLPDPLRRFVLHWGEMGDVWGVNRSVAQIHALLFIAERPMTAEEISETLSMARSNVSTSLRELLGWNLIRRVQVLGDRRDFYEAEADMLAMVRRIAEGRKAREIDPALEMLRRCAEAARTDRDVPLKAKQRLAGMLDFVETVDRGFTQIIRLPSPTLMALLKLGGRLARFVGGKPGK